MAQDPYRYFRPEAGELVEAFAKGLLDLEKGVNATGAVHKLLRLAHTLKGAARVVKQSEIAELAHAIEDTLSPLRDEGGSPPDQASIDSVLENLDRISKLLSTLKPVADEDAAKRNSIATPQASRTVRTDIAEVDAVLDGVSETHALVNSGGTPDQLDRELRQLREAAERLRLAPAASLFTALERIARDTALTLGKTVTFSGKGGEIRLDSGMLEALQNALIQLVRNAVAHGIESAGDRLAAGKPLAGRVTVEVSRRGRQIAFACSDDGRGIDLDAVRNAAQQRGLLSSAGRAADAGELMRLLLKGGISTAPAVTAVSGRGIGLDVVREVAEQLDGRISFHSHPAEGTRFELLIPASLSSLDVLFVETDVNGGDVAIPLEAVRRTVRVDTKEIFLTATGANLLFDNKTIPFAPLAKLLTGFEAVDRDHWTVVVVQGADGVAATGVARLRGAVKAVIRPLPAGMAAAAMVAGATLDPEGNPQLVLDPDGLVAAVCRGYTANKTSPPAKRPVLVVDDSMTTRMLEKSILESAGYEVDVATSGEEGLDCLRNKPSALILVDVEMPGMDGFTFIEQLRADRGLRDIPAILVTSRASPDDLKRGREAGANGHIVKSEFDQAELLSMIERLTGA